jgi:hypothetical protein
VSNGDDKKKKDVAPDLETWRPEGFRNIPKDYASPDVEDVRVPTVRLGLFDRPPALEKQRTPPREVELAPKLPPGTYPVEKGLPAPSMKRGGAVRVSGLYRLHKGEQVMPKSVAGRYREKKHG